MPLFDYVGPDPDFIEKYLSDVLRVRRVALEMRREESPSWDLSQRIAFSGLLETIDGWIFESRAALARLGVPCKREVA
jgi:hypothetical protein